MTKWTELFPAPGPHRPPHPGPEIPEEDSTYRAWVNRGDTYNAYQQQLRRYLLAQSVEELQNCRGNLNPEQRIAVILGIERLESYRAVDRTITDAILEAEDKKR